MKYKDSKQKRYYTDETIIKLVEFLSNNINYYFEDTDDECWITEKEEPAYLEDMVKDGIHIIFPNIIGHTKVFKEFIKNIMKEDNNKEILINIFKETSEDNIIPSNKPEEIIDSNVQRWFVYGDCKPEKTIFTDKSHR